MKTELIDKIIGLRTAVSYLGEKKSWWNSNFYDDSSKDFLTYVFPKSDNLQFNGSAISTRHFMDSEVGATIEGRRRVKEQMDKMKDDDEFAGVDLSYLTTDGKEVIVYCPESQDVLKGQSSHSDPAASPAVIDEKEDENIVTSSDTGVFHSEDISSTREPIEKHLKVHYGDIGYSYEDVLKDYLIGAKEITIQDPYIRQKHQISNFLKLAELLVKIGDCNKIHLVTSSDDSEQERENNYAFEQIADSLFENEIEFTFEFSDTIHDRQIETSNGWRIVMGRGLDYFQSLAGNYLQIGVNDQSLRACLECGFDFIKVKKA